MSNATPTDQEQDIFLRWLDFVSDQDNSYDPKAQGTKLTTGTVFGKPTTAKSVFCIGNGFIDMEVETDKEDKEIGKARVIIFFKELQCIQVHVGFGDPETEVHADMKRCDAFQVYQKDKLIKFIKDVVA